MNKRIIYVTIITTVILLLLYPLYFYKQKQLIKDAQEKIDRIADERLEKLTAYFDNYHNLLKKIAGNPNTIQHFQQFNKFVKSKDLKNQKYLDFANEYKKFLNLNLPNKDELNNLFLISTEGDVIFSRAPRAELGTNLLTGPYANSSFNTALTRVLMTLTFNIEQTNFYPVTKGNALFILVPIVNKFQLLGVIALEFGFNNLFELVTNYDNLGETGEVIIAQYKDDKVKYVSNVRHSMFSLGWSFENALKRNVISSFAQYAQGQEVEFIGDQSKVLFEATLGNCTSGLDKDYRNKEVISAGRYYVTASWGLVAKIDINEVLQSIWLLQVIIFLILLVASSLLIFLLTKFLIRKLKIKSYFSFIFLILSFLFSLIALYFIYSYKTNVRSVVESHTNEDKKNLLTAKKQISRKLEYIKYIADNLAYKINSNLIDQEQYETYIKLALKENPNFIAMALAFRPFEFDNKALFTPYGIRKNNIVECCQLETLKNIIQPQEDYRSSWYHLPLTDSKSHWITNYIEPTSGKRTVVYAVPFKMPNKKENSGVIAIMYSFDDIENIVNDVYASLLSESGHFLIDYTRRYINLNKSVSELAVELNEPVINNIALMYKKNIPKLSYYNDDTDQQEWLFSSHIPIANWMLIMQDNINEMSFPYRDLQKYQLLATIFFTLFLLFLLSCLFFFRNLNVFYYSLVLTLILSAGLIALLAVIYRNVVALNKPEVSIEYEVYVTNFIKELNEDAFLKFKKPIIPIKTAIDLKNIDLKHNGSAFTGLIWQKYPQTLNFEPAIIFPQSSKSTTSLIQSFNKEDIKVVNWLTNNEIFEESNFGKYPFDVRKIVISMEYPKTHSNIMFVPDLEAYSMPSSNSKMGIGTLSKIGGFTVRKSYFEYMISQSTNYTDQVQPVLSFNILLQRSLLNPFFVYFMPLLLILIALFAVIYAFEKASQITDAIKFQSIAIITALLLSLVLLHRNLRTDLQTQGIMYIEYLFFSIYVIMSLLVLYIVFVKESIKIIVVEQRIPIITFLYWPIAMLVWYIITVLIFF